MRKERESKGTEKELNEEVQGFSKAKKELNEEGKGINEREKELNEEEKGLARLRRNYVTKAMESMGQRRS
jgi:hypothetical protein